MNRNQAFEEWFLQQGFSREDLKKDNESVYVDDRTYLLAMTWNACVTKMGGRRKQFDRRLHRLMSQKLGHKNRRFVVRRAVDDTQAEMVQDKPKIIVEH